MPIKGGTAPNVVSANAVKTIEIASTFSRPQ